MWHRNGLPSDLFQICSLPLYWKTLWQECLQQHFRPTPLYRHCSRSDKALFRSKSYLRSIRLWVWNVLSRNTPRPKYRPLLRFLQPQPFDLPQRWELRTQCAKVLLFPHRRLLCEGGRNLGAFRKSAPCLQRSFSIHPWLSPPFPHLRLPNRRRSITLLLFRLIFLCPNNLSANYMIFSFACCYVYFKIVISSTKCFAPANLSMMNRQ